jgi:hypothetical protein
MYFIIETSDQLKRLTPGESCFVQAIPSSDRYHPGLTRASLFYYNAGSKGYILSVNHSEGMGLETHQIRSFLSAHRKVYVLDRKFHSYFMDVSNTVDLQNVRMDQGIDQSKLECDTVAHRDFYRRLSMDPIVNELLPITKHYERCECLYGKVQTLMDLERDSGMLDRASDAYGWVERQGIAVSVPETVEAYGLEHTRNFIRDGLAYSYYNMYNMTGRPTNSFNGINFVAVPKAERFRRCFVPGNDFLVELDFDAYHLRLIAKQIGYEFPEGSIHSQLGQHYFGKTDLTDEEYAKSKELTFKQLYGGIDQKYSGVEFFSRMGSFIDEIWQRYRRDGSIELPTGRLLRRSQEVNKLKLFNYWIQNLETRNNTEKIEKLREYMTDCKSRLILITYDAFLFDYSIQDGKEFLVQIKAILEEGGYKVKHKHAKDYFFE